MAVERALRQYDRAANAPARHVGGLVARALHARSWPVARRARGVRAPPRRRVDLPRQAPRELGPGAAHGALRSRSGQQRRARQALAPALSRGRRARPVSGRGHHAARDDAGRHRRRRAPARRTLCKPGRQAGRAAADGPQDPDHRGRVRGPRVRHWLREDHAGARLQRLRGRAASRATDDRRARRERAPQRRGAAGVSRPRPLRRPRARAGGSCRTAISSSESRTTSRCCRAATAAAWSSSRCSRTSGMSARSPSPRRPSKPSSKAGSVSFRKTTRAITSTGCAKSRIGASHDSFGGDTGSRPGTTTRATSTSRATRPRSAASMGSPPRLPCARTRTCSTRGSPPRCGHSRRSAGPTRRRSSRRSIPPACSSRAGTSSSSGSPG